jgi:hypothetical protein
MWASSLRFAALALLPSSALGAQVVFNLNIVNAKLSPDGFVREWVTFSVRATPLLTTF